MWREQIRPAFMVFIVLTVITGVIYPLFVTGVAQIFFYKQANGSLLYAEDGSVVGSSLVGQNFDDPRYFWGRPSATSPAYNALASSGSNLGPSNPALVAAVRARIAALKIVDPENQAAIPIDLVSASASGLDPHLSLAGAYYQLSRVARLRKLPEAKVRQIVQQNISGRFLGLAGEPVINILKVNLALDSLN